MLQTLPYKFHRGSTFESSKAALAKRDGLHYSPYPGENKAKLFCKPIQGTRSTYSS